MLFQYISELSPSPHPHLLTLYFPHKLSCYAHCFSLLFSLLTYSTFLPLYIPLAISIHIQLSVWLLPKKWSDIPLPSPPVTHIHVNPPITHKTLTPVTHSSLHHSHTCVFFLNKLFPTTNQLVSNYSALHFFQVLYTVSRPLNHFIIHSGI